MEIRKLLLVTLTICAFGCKKDGNDTIKYNWKRDLYRGAVTQDGPASTGTSGKIDFKIAIYVSTDFVVLTEKGMVKQRDSMFKANKGMFAYDYEKQANK